MTVGVIAPLLGLSIAVGSLLPLAVPYPPPIILPGSSTPPSPLHSDEERLVLRPLYPWLVWLLRLLGSFPLPLPTVVTAVLFLSAGVGPV